MGSIVELGHAGIMVEDLAGCRDFYTEILGLSATDEDFDFGIVFLSSRPEFEHHELVLQRGRRTDQASTVQQISWRVADLEALQAFHAKFLEAEVKIDRIVTHGNAVGIYFFDPEGNRNEVYFQTGRAVHQPFAKPIDIGRDSAVVQVDLERLVDEHERR